MSSRPKKTWLSWACSVVHLFLSLSKGGLEGRMSLRGGKLTLVLLFLESFLTSKDPLILMCNIFSAWPRQSYGVDHLLTFANLRQLGLLVEQQPGETLTVMESKVGKLVNDKTAGDETRLFNLPLIEVPSVALHMPQPDKWFHECCKAESKIALKLSRSSSFTSCSRKADRCLLVSCKEEQFQSAEQKAQPCKYHSGYLLLIPTLKNAVCLFIYYHFLCTGAKVGWRVRPARPTRHGLHLQRCLHPSELQARGAGEKTSHIRWFCRSWSETVSVVL